MLHLLIPLCLSFHLLKISLHLFLDALHYLVRCPHRQRVHQVLDGLDRPLYLPGELHGPGILEVYVMQPRTLIEVVLQLPLVDPVRCQVRVIRRIPVLLLQLDQALVDVLLLREELAVDRTDLVQNHE